MYCYEIILQFNNYTEIKEILFYLLKTVLCMVFGTFCGRNTCTKSAKPDVDEHGLTP